ncbi:glycosyl hydrolase family 28-related protein [Cellulomonas fulva]|nr:glycosyl hydrolase family 28-related protein [Cellulomonas fulva]
MGAAVAHRSAQGGATVHTRIPRSPRPLLVGAALAALVGGLVVPAAAADSRTAAEAAGGSATAVTRAGLDPALSAGRGSWQPVVEHEAENAVTTGDVIGPGREAYTLEAEASGRTAVRLDAPGEYVEVTLTQPADAITVRYALPDAPGGGGLDATLRVTAPKVRLDLPVTSRYSWLYNQYPFTNDPDADLLHPDWWLAECGCVPAEQPEPVQISKPFRPFHFYAEQRALLGRTVPAGAKIRITLPAGAEVDWAVVDVVDLQRVGGPRPAPYRAVDATRYGADPTGRKDSARAIEKAIVVARHADRPVYVPAGTYRVDRHIVVDDVTIAGAGSWWTIFRGRSVALDEPAPDGSTHTGVGFYGKDAADGGSHDVVLKDFAIVGDVTERIDDDQVNGVGGALSDSVLNRLYIQRTKVGVWVDGPMSDLVVQNSVIVDQLADGLNFHTGVTDSVAVNNVVRNTGDDALAMWADGTTNARNVFRRNTVQSPTLANGIAIYGGTDITVAKNLVADPLREGSALHLGTRFGAEPFAGTTRLQRNTTVRAGGRELNWDIGMGALWVYALERSIDSRVLVRGEHYLDSTYNAIMLVTEYGKKDELSISGLEFANIQVDGAGTSVVSARTAGSASFRNVDVRNVGWAGVNNCGAFTWDFEKGSEFTLVDLGDNDGTTTTPWEPGPANWLSRYTPNTISCQDRPAVVAPPAPSPWTQP